MANKKKISSFQIERNWKKEVQKRIDFGISNENIWRYSNTTYASIMFLRDFDSLYNSYLAMQSIPYKPHHIDYEKKKLHIDSVKKYTKYVFKQLEDSDGVLQLSKVCGFVKIIVEKNIEYKGCKIEIFHRIKNANKSNIYPKKVIDLFKNNSTCRAVAYKYIVPIERKVIVETYKKAINSYL